MIYEIRVHGRGGQGAVVASKLLASAAFREGKHSQSFPFFGSERRGAAVTAFVRIGDEPIRVRSEIYAPHGVVVLDSDLIQLGLADVTKGLRPDGWALINSVHEPDDFKKLAKKVATVNATDIALRHGLGTRAFPIVNTAILGALANLGVVGIKAVVDAIRAEVPNRPEENADSAEEAYKHTLKNFKESKL